MNKLFIYVLLLSCSASFLSMTCDTPDYVPFHRVTLINCSNESIYYTRAPYDEYLPLTPYRIFVEMPGFSNPFWSLPVGGRDSTFTIDEDGSDAVGLIIFKQSTLKNHTKEKLVEKDIHDGQYNLHYDELKNMDFKIIFTGEKSQ